MFPGVCVQDSLQDVYLGVKHGVQLDQISPLVFQTELLPPPVCDSSHSSPSSWLLVLSLFHFLVIRCVEHIIFIFLGYFEVEPFSMFVCHFTFSSSLHKARANQ